MKTDRPNGSRKRSRRPIRRIQTWYVEQVDETTVQEFNPGEEEGRANGEFNASGEARQNKDAKQTVNKTTNGDTTNCHRGKEETYHDVQL